MGKPGDINEHYEHLKKIKSMSEEPKQKEFIPHFTSGSPRVGSSLKDELEKVKESARKEKHMPDYLPKQKACICYCHQTAEAQAYADRNSFDKLKSCEHCKPDPSLSTWEEGVKDLEEKLQKLLALKITPGYRARTLKRFIDSQISLAIQKERDNIEYQLRIKLRSSFTVAGLPAETTDKFTIVEKEIAEVFNKGVEEK